MAGLHTRRWRGCNRKPTLLQRGDADGSTKEQNRGAMPRRVHHQRALVPQSPRDARRRRGHNLERCHLFGKSERFWSVPETRIEEGLLGLWFALVAQTSKTFPNVRAAPLLLGRGGRCWSGAQAGELVSHLQELRINEGNADVYNSNIPAVFF